MKSYQDLSSCHSKTGTTFMDNFSYETGFEISQAIYTWKKKRRDHLVSFSWLGIKGKNCYLKVQKREHELQVSTRQLK